MSSQQKRGFRLPWAADHASEEGAAGAATMDPPTDDAASEMASEELGEGPFGIAGATAPSTTDPAPAASDVPEPTAEATMIDVETTTESTTSEAGSPAAGNSEWPDVDRRTSPQHADDAELSASRPPIHAVGEGRIPRRENPLVAGLVKAMREAAVASREETTTRLQADAETRVAGIRGRATSEAAELKHRAEADISEIRDWSKAEIARIREETEGRIESRKTDLAGETERHAASVERLVSEVQSVVATFESDMEAFFQRLLAEDDPARLAALAEQAPDAPDLTGEGPAAIDLIDDPAVIAEAATAAIDAAAASSDVTPANTEGEADAAGSSDEAASEPVAEGLEPAAAAAAEVAASEGLDMSAAASWPAVSAAPQADGDGSGVSEEGATQLMVTGLTSVAGISAFKGALGQLQGVRSVSVSSGDPGVFVFAISHEPQIDLATGIAGLAGFAARITDATDAGITVVAHEPAA